MNDESTNATLEDAVGDLHALLKDQRLAAYETYEAPREAVTPEELVARVGPTTVIATGVRGSAAALVVRALAAQGKPVVVIAPNADDVESLEGDVRFFLPEGAAVKSFLHNEATPYADINADRRAAELRLAVLDHLERQAPLDALILTAPALVRLVPPPAVLREHRTLVRTNDDIDRDALIRGLTAAGYARAPVVEDPGTFAVRGGIIDGWPGGRALPVRIECFGDGVMSIKNFDPETQRSAEEVSEVLFGLNREAPLAPAAVQRARARVAELCDAVNVPSAKARALIEDVTSGRSFFGSDGYTPAFVDTVPLFEFLPSNAVFVFVNPAGAERAIAEVREEAKRAREERALDPTFPLEAFFAEPAAVRGALQHRPKLALLESAVDNVQAVSLPSDLLDFPPDLPTLYTFDQGGLIDRVREAQRRGKDQALAPLLLELEHYQRKGFKTTIVARTETQRDRISSLLAHKDRDLHHSLELVRGTLSRGLVAPKLGLAFITEDEIFGTRSRVKARAKRSAKAGNPARAFLEDLKSLAVGDFVVHVEHGVGRYAGLIHQAVAGHTVDLIVVEYGGSDKLYLPVYRLNQIQKFSGGEGTPRLDKLGGQTFAKTKARAQREVRQMADELLRLYAERKSAERPPFSAPDDSYRSFEATFPYEETKDQARAIQDVEADLERPIPMDRLVCGDVGFGKTEVAIRAAFRAAMAGRQVAVLCPTTILAQQHFLNFSARMQNHPIEVRALSRFTKKADESELMRRMKEGSVDVVVGTHRLLSKDVFWKKLGLLIVDEEQRFGVVHKERIKQLRTNVDVLTLTATPIPRTLQMAVSGLRDMSVITTPPVDRRAIRTIVTRDDPAVLREAVTRELERGGQVFYVYNRVADLHEKAARLAELVPRARIAVAHGQMSEAALEKTMVDFVDGHYDILCTTAIVESGLDIPRANTIIIDRADMFGLAQLYQLRGRVGRARERAYAYLVVPPVDRMSDEARLRVLAIEQHTELGSGFRVASLDLELRGAGDLLGSSQSGTASAVGFELFCTMLEEAVLELQGQPKKAAIDPEISIDDEALLPEDYIEDIGVRLSLYKRLASAEGDGEVVEIGNEMEERFGAPPLAAKRFLTLMRLKTELRQMRVLGLEATKKSATAHISEDTPLDIEKVLGLVSKKNSPYKLTPDMRLTRRTQPNEDIRSGLESADRLLADLALCLKPEA